jgi:hypothetical protein
MPDFDPPGHASRTPSARRVRLADGRDSHDPTLRFLAAPDGPVEVAALRCLASLFGPNLHRGISQPRPGNRHALLLTHGKCGGVAVEQARLEPDLNEGARSEP